MVKTRQNSGYASGCHFLATPEVYSLAIAPLATEQRYERPLAVLPY